MADAVERCPDGDTPDTYIPPKDGWCCFHCGVVFLTPEAAREHFGERPEGKPLCLIKVGMGERRALLRIRELEAQVTMLQLALCQIDSHNDSPARFDSHIDQIIWRALRVLADTTPNPVQEAVDAAIDLNTFLRKTVGGDDSALVRIVGCDDLTASAARDRFQRLHVALDKVAP